MQAGEGRPASGLTSECCSGRRVPPVTIDREARDRRLERERGREAVGDDDASPRSARSTRAWATASAVEPTSRNTLAPAGSEAAAATADRALRRGAAAGRVFERRLAGRRWTTGIAPPCTRRMRPSRLERARSARTVTSLTPNRAARDADGEGSRPREPRPRSDPGGSRVGGWPSVLLSMLLAETKADFRYRNAMSSGIRRTPTRARRRARAHLLRRRRHDPRPRARRRRPRARPAPETATMRQDVLTGEWISIAAARQNRVFLPPADRDPLAPQTPENPSESRRLRRRRVREPLPLVRSRRSASAEASRLTEARPRAHPHRGRALRGRLLQPRARGARSARRPSAARAPSSRRGPIAPPRSRRCPASSRSSRSRTAARQIGVTLHHPHGQIYAYPYVTPRTTQHAGRRRHAPRPTCSSASSTSSARGERVVLSGEHWTAFVPFAARWPIEVHLLPHRHVPDFAATTDEERDELAALYLRLLRGVDALYDTPTPVHRRLAPGAGPRRAGRHPAAPAAHLAAPRRRQAQVPGRIRSGDGRLDRRHPARDAGRRNSERRSPAYERLPRRALGVTSST